MRELSSLKTQYISGGAIKDSDQKRAAGCRDDIERAGDTGERIGGRLGRLAGSAWGIKNSKDCQDQIRLHRQREEIERRRNGD